MTTHPWAIRSPRWWANFGSKCCWEYQLPAWPSPSNTLSSNNASKKPKFEDLIANAPKSGWAACHSFFRATLYQVRYPRVFFQHNTKFGWELFGEILRRISLPGFKVPFSFWTCWRFVLQNANFWRLQHLILMQFTVMSPSTHWWIISNSLKNVTCRLSQWDRTTIKVDTHHGLKVSQCFWCPGTPKILPY